MPLRVYLSEKGQGMVEYAFVLAFIIVIGAIFVNDVTVSQALSAISDSLVALFAFDQ